MRKNKIQATKFVAKFVAWILFKNKSRDSHPEICSFISIGYAESKLFIKSFIKNF